MGLALVWEKKYKPKQLTIRNEVSVNCVRHKSALTKQIRTTTFFFMNCIHTCFIKRGWKVAIQQLLGLALWQQHACDGTLKNTTMFGFLINKMDGSSGHHHHQRSEIMMGSIISLAARCWLLWQPWSLARRSLGLELRSCGPRPSLPPPCQTQHVSRPASSATFSLHALHAQN